MGKKVYSLRIITRAAAYLPVNPRPLRSLI